jgi:hypothetical protein
MMAKRVAAIFADRDDAERAADALVELGADRDQISVIGRHDEEEDATAWTDDTDPDADAYDDDDLIEPAREVGDAGAPLTTTDAGEATKGAAIGAVAGLAAGLLALTVPGIGLVFAVGPLAAAMAGGAVAGGVYGGLRDIGIEETHARGYEERVRSGDVLMTALLPPTMTEDEILDVLSRYDAEDVSFFDDRQPSWTPAAATAVGASTTGAGAADVIDRDLPLRGEFVEIEEEVDAEVEEVGTADRRGQ